MMKPKEEISGFNFDLIRLCNKCHNYAMGSFVLDSGEQVMTTFLVGLAHLFGILEKNLFLFIVLGDWEFLQNPQFIKLYVQLYSCRP